MTDVPGRAFVVLLGAGHAARAAARLRHRLPAAKVLVPPVSGLSFFTASGAEADALDAWYSTAGLGIAPPVLLFWHDPELAGWVQGADAAFVVATPDAAAGDRYAGLPRTVTVVTRDAVTLADAACDAFGHAGAEPSTSLAGEIGSGPVMPTPPPLPDPFQLLADVPSRTEADARGAPQVAANARLPTANESPGDRPLRRLLDRLRSGRREPAEPTPRLQDALGALPGVCVAVLGRPGGAGRTGSAAAIAAVLGGALSAFGTTVALVAANADDERSWAPLGINGSPPLLEDLVRALGRGEPPPRAGYGGAPTLVVYPDRPRRNGAYAPADVKRAAAYLRTQHVVVVVDLPPLSALRDAAKAAITAAWIAEANAVVLPATADETSLSGALHFLAQESMRGRPLVVGWIGRRPRRGRATPEAVALSHQMESHAARVVELPEDDAGTVALLQRRSEQEVSEPLRQGYERLAGAVSVVARPA